VHDAVGHLLQGGLALSGSRSPAEILLGEDVGGVQAPGGGDLDVELLEGDTAVAVVGDARVAPLPHELVVGMDPFGGEVPPNADSGPLRGDCHVRVPPFPWFSAYGAGPRETAGLPAPFLPPTTTCCGPP